MFTSKLRWRISKPLIPLKAALFFYFAAGAAIFPFVQVFLKQKGITVKQLSFIYMVNPFVQFLGPLLSGIIADKLGRSKPVLLGNVLLAMISLCSMLFIPVINKSSCGKEIINITCYSGVSVSENIEDCRTFDNLKCWTHCPVSLENIPCNENYNKLNCFKAQNEIFTSSKEEVIANITKVGKANSSCQVELSFSHNLILNWCEDVKTQQCNLTCQPNFTSPNNKDDCEDFYDNSTLVFSLSLIFLVLFHTMASNGYRILDVTTMSMTKTYNSDFGRERFWSISGILIFSGFSGYVVDATSYENGSKNYNAAIYLYVACILVALASAFKLEVAIEPPGKQMAKKSLILIRNIDVLAFILAVLILGTCWCFGRQFGSLYLDTLGAPSLLLGLTPAVNSLFGLPFLLCSNFWVDKLGSGKLLVLGFAGHVAYYVGYMFLINPWWCLAIEITGIFNYHLLWVAIIRHSHSIAPKGLTATVISTAGGLHYAIGKGTGSAIGGLTMSKYGGRTAFKLMAAIAGGAGALYALFLYLRSFYNKEDSDVTCEMKGETKTNFYKDTELQPTMPDKEPEMTKC